jgi:hypothetical protein
LKERVSGGEDAEEIASELNPHPQFAVRIWPLTSSPTDEVAVATVRSEPSSALNQLNNEHNDRNHDQKVDQTAANVTDKAQKPEHH